MFSKTSIVKAYQTDVQMHSDCKTVLPFLYMPTDLFRLFLAALA